MVVLQPNSTLPYRLTGGPNENCETVKNVLFGLTPVMALLKDSTEGLKTGVLAGLTSLLCSRCKNINISKQRTLPRVYG